MNQPFAPRGEPLTGGSITYAPPRSLPEKAWMFVKGTLSEAFTPYYPGSITHIMALGVVALTGAGVYYGVKKLSRKRQ